MAGGTYNQTAKTRYLDALDQIRERRQATWQAMTANLVALVQRIEAHEVACSQAAQAINASGNRREGARAYMRARWEARQRGESLAQRMGVLHGPHCERVDKATHQAERLRSFDKRTIQRLGVGDQGDALYAAALTLRQRGKHRERLLTDLRRVATDADALPPGEQAGGPRHAVLGERIPRVVPENAERAMLQRREAMGDLLDRLHAAFARVEALEGELGECMWRVNELGTHNRNLICRWRLPSDLENVSAGGLQGPMWAQLLKGRYRRHLRRFDRPINRQALRDTYQKRQARQLLPLAREIQRMSDERRELVERLIRIEHRVKCHQQRSDTHGQP